MQPHLQRCAKRWRQLIQMKREEEYEIVSYSLLASHEKCEMRMLYIVEQTSSFLQALYVLVFHQRQNDSGCLGSRTIETFQMHLAVSHTATVLAISFFYI